MSIDGVRLGPFELRSRVGRGAAGEVFLAEHTGQGVEVAVKVLSRKEGWARKHLERFRAEVKAMAELHHHGVVLVLDYGEVSLDASADSEGRLQAGAPYFAMELARHGSLHAIRGNLSFHSIRSILLVILEALAHAHAHGVVHRDIKPANVLVFGQSPGRPDLKLTDFGIAQAAGDREREGRVENSMGTPQYMAPEQFRGLWRDYGAWTDLYAVGCMAYELAAGEVPFEADTFLEHAYKHTRMERPPLPGEGRFPQAFEKWIRRLMQVQPQHRFQRAADAAWALREMEDPDANLDEPVLPHLPLYTRSAATPTSAAATDLGADPSLPWSVVTLDSADLPAATLPPTSELGANDSRNLSEGLAGTASQPQVLARGRGDTNPAAPVLGVGGARPDDVPPMRDTWRTDTPPRRSMQLVGAGLGLYDVRTVPFVGREVERDVVWRALRDVRRSGRPRVLSLVGAAGVGKSRLVEWMCQRAHEVGAATPMLAVHDPNPGPAVGLSRMLARHLRCVGMTRPELAKRLQRLFKRYGPVSDGYLLRALLELIAPATQEQLRMSGAHLRFNRPAERYAAMLDWMRHEARARPLILWLDDVQWGRDALDFVNHAVSSEQPAPILFLLTARDEALAQRPAERERLELLLDTPGTGSLAVGPLPEDANAALVEDLLGMDSQLARDVEARGGGNPLFAIQLVGDWVQRGVLTLGEHGFVLREGERAELPDDLHEVAATRLQLALDGREDGAREALEIAAALGRTFDSVEWEEACAAEGVAHPATLGRGLLDHRLLHAEERGFAFAHGIIAESLERGAREAGRWENHHLACARMLTTRYEDTPGLAARIAGHLLAAGRDKGALSPLLAAAEDQMRVGAYEAALDTLLTRDVAIEGLRLPIAHEARWQSRMLRARLLVLRGELEEAKAVCVELADAESHGDAHLQVQARALQCLGDIARIRGEMDRARAYYHGAMKHFESRGHLAGQWETLAGIAEVALQTGALRTAEAFFVRVREFGERLSDRQCLGTALLGLGRTAYQAGTLDDAEGLLTRARETFERCGARSHGVDCLHALGDVHRAQGRHQAARDDYRTALSFYGTVGSGLAAHVRLSLALWHAERCEWSPAADFLAECLSAFEATGERDDLGRAHAVLLVCAAGREDWEGYDAHLGTAAAHLGDTARADRDIALCFALAVEHARQSGQTARADAAQELADAQRALLGTGQDGT